MTSQDVVPKPTVYYENWMLKKEGVTAWVSYWGVIRGKWLQFYERTNINEKPELRKTLELTSATQCSLVKRNKRRYPFSINNGLGTYYMKCDTELARYHWIFSILSASQGKPRRELPTEIPSTMLEKEAFKKDHGMNENDTPKTSPTKSVAKATDFHNRRRHKYAVRNENRLKRKEAKRAKKLGLDSNADTSVDGSPVKESKFKSQDELRRTQKIRFDSKDELRRYNSMNILQDNYLLPLKRKESATELRQNTHEDLVTQTAKPLNSVQIKAMIHSGMETSVCDNLAFEGEEDINVLPQVSISLGDEQLLPNMVITHDSDSDTDTGSTAETSLNSQCGSFLSLSSTDISGKTSDIITHTFLSNTDDGYEQRASDGRVIAPPKLAVRKNKAISITQSLELRSLSAGARLQVNSGLLDRSISPSKERPISPSRSPINFSRFSVNSPSVSNS